MDVTILLALLILVCGVVGGVMLFVGGEDENLVDKRLRSDAYVRAFEKTRERTKKMQERQASAYQSPLYDRVNKFETILNRADIKMDAVQFLIVFNLFALAAIFFLNIRFFNNWGIASIVGYSGAAALTHMYLRRREKKRMQVFLHNFPNVLDFIIRGVRSGLPLGNQVHLISENFDEPVKSLFVRVSSFVRLGLPLHEALQRVGDEMRLVEFHLFVTAVSVQQQAGGSISESFGRLASMMRKRIGVAQQLKSQTSQIRASGYVVLAMPIAVFGLVSLLQPGYFRPIYETDEGTYLMAAAAFLVGCAIISMNVIMKERF